MSVDIDKLEYGMQLRYTGTTDIQVTYGGHSDPRVDGLVEGNIYTLSDFSIGNWKTHIELEGFTGHYNSVVFDEVSEENDG